MALATAVLALGVLPVGARAAGTATAAVYRVEQDVTLAEGQEGSYTVGCRDGDLAVDGTWRVDAIATAPDDDQSYDLVSALDVIAAEPFGPGGYTFALRNRAEGDAQVHLGVLCLKGAVTAADGSPHAVRVSPVHGQSTSTGEAGALISPPLACPAGSVTVAPGFAATGGPARLVSRFPMRNRLEVLDRSFTALGPTLVRTSVRCLYLRTADGGPRLRVKLRTGDTTLAAGRVAEATVSCAAGERALVGLFRLDGAWSLGGSLRGIKRTFKVQAASATASGSAQIGALCLAQRF